MSLNDLKNKFDQALASMTDGDIVAAFAEMDCDIVIESGK